MNDMDSEEQNLTACKFLARSEVRIVEMTFWRFGCFFGYFQKIIPFLMSFSKSTRKIIPRNEFSSPNYPIIILTILAILSFSKNLNDKISRKMLFFMNDMDSEEPNLPACKF